MVANHRQFASLYRWSLLVMIGGVALCAIVSLDEPARLWRAYLFALVTCSFVTIGGFGLLALGNLTGGRWAVAARPFYLSQMQTLPLMVLLWIPVPFGIQHIYPWAYNRDALAMMPSKAEYLSPQFFVGRSFGYLTIWLVLWWILKAVSRLDVSPATTSGMRRAGALALVLLVPTSTFAAFDWAMSLEPLWYSSIYGAILTAAGVLAAHAIAICGLAAITPAGLRSILQAAGDYLPPNADASRQTFDVYHDAGKLLLAFVMVFTYFAFSQFIIIWYGNLPSETVWYLRRLNGGWQWLAVILLVFHFAVPFFLLLHRELKRAPRRLAAVALLLLVMYAAHQYWNIVPAFPRGDAAWHATNIGAILAIGGAWFAAYSWNASRYLTRLPAADVDGDQ